MTTELHWSHNTVRTYHRRHMRGKTNSTRHGRLPHSMRGECDTIQHSRRGQMLAHSIATRQFKRSAGSTNAKNRKEIVVVIITPLDRCKGETEALTQHQNSYYSGAVKLHRRYGPLNPVHRCRRRITSHHHRQTSSTTTMKATVNPRRRNQRRTKNG